MTKKYILSSVILVLFMTVIVTGTTFAEESEQEQAQEEKQEQEKSSQPNLAPEAESAILMDMDTGSVLYEKNSQEKLPPASITKIMTMLLIMEAVEGEEIAWTDQVRTSERAASMGGSQIFLEEGEEMTVEELMKGIAIASANDASVALAEHIAGTEENFIQMMNDRAQELGMSNTVFKNTNGLPEDGHVTTAEDIALMSRELMKHEEVTRFTSVYEDYLRQDSDDPFWLVNTNRMVKFYEGMDGLKTGYTSDAKYCLASTAKRDHMRAIAVVMGAPTPKERNAHIFSLLDYAFSQYETHPIYDAGEVLDSIHVDKGEKTETDMAVPHQVSILTKKGESIEDYEINLKKKDDLSAPIEQGDTIGSVTVQKDGVTKTEVDIVATEDIPQATLWQMLKRTTLSMFGISS